MATEKENFHSSDEEKVVIAIIARGEGKRKKF